MSTLEGKKVVVIGGTSGIGFGVAKLSILSKAAEVIVASSSKDNVSNAVSRLEAILAGTNLPGKVTGEIVDAKDLSAIKTFLEKIGNVDHLVWTSGDALQLGFKNIDLGKQRRAFFCTSESSRSLLIHHVQKDMFDVRFWAAAKAAQVVKIRQGGSITLTIGERQCTGSRLLVLPFFHSFVVTGTAILRPQPTYALVAGLAGAIDALARGLAVDLAPTRVNVVCPGLVKTEVRLFRAFLVIEY